MEKSKKIYTKSGLYSFLYRLLYLPMRTIYPTTVVGKDNLPLKKGIVTVSNHLSWKDMPMIGLCVAGYRRPIGKKELGKKTFVRKFILKVGAILLDRDKTDLTSLRECINTLKAGGSLCIFPEGTRNRTGDDIQEIKGGVTMIATKGNADVVPIVIHHKWKAFRRNYIMVGEPFNLNEKFGKVLDVETTALAAQYVGEQMISLKQKLTDFVNMPKKERNKQLKTEKKQYKINKRERKIQLKAEKKQRKAEMRERKIQLKAEKKLKKSNANVDNVVGGDE